MSAKKTFSMTFVLLCACALVAGCGSDSVSPTVDDAPILPPQNVTANSSAASKMMLTWEPNTQNKLAGYNVYRRDVLTQDVVKLNTSLVTVAMFEDTSARRNVLYEYRVTSVGTNGKESTYVSVEALITVLQNEDHPKIRL